MRRLSAVLLAVIALAGCSRPSSALVHGRHAWTVPHVLRIIDLSEPDHLNPYLSQMDISYALTSLIYSYLVISDDHGRLVGDLATTVPTLRNGGISADGRTYTYHLRHGVRWHDGVPFTARDVVASWKAVVNPHNLTIYRQGYDRVTSIDTPDDYTVIVHLRERYPPFVTQFFAPLQEGAKPILPAHIIARGDFNRGPLNTTAIGTGPFKFVSWKHGEGITLVRNDGYFKGRPKLARIEFRVIPDAQTELTEMRLHHADLIYTPNAAIYPQYQALPDTSVYTVPWNQQGLVVINGGKPGLGDVAVRQAIELAIDKNEIIQRALHGVYDVPRDTVAPTAVGHVNRSPYPFDPARANALLDANGWKRGPNGIRRKSGIRLDYTIAIIAGTPTYERMAVIMQQQLRAIGVRLSVKAYPYNQIFDFNGPIDTYKYDMAAYGSALNWDPDTHVYYGCDQWFPKGQNYYRYCNPRYDALERQGLQSDDPAVRARAYEQADAILWNTVSYIPIFQSRRIVVRNPDLQNYRPNPTSIPWWNAWQWDI